MQNIVKTKIKRWLDSVCQWNHDLLFRLAASVAFNEIMFYTVWLRLSSKHRSPRQAEWNLGVVSFYTMYINKIINYKNTWNWKLNKINKKIALNFVFHSLISLMPWYGWNIAKVGIKHQLIIQSNKYV